MALILNESNTRELAQIVKEAGALVTRGQPAGIQSACGSSVGLMGAIVDNILAGDG
jgi:hypothetical protein